jgi:hypothetical protein
MCGAYLDIGLKQGIFKVEWDSCYPKNVTHAIGPVAAYEYDALGRKTMAKLAAPRRWATDIITAVK